MPEIGEVTSEGENCFKWNIERFGLVYENNEEFCSPIFTYSNRRCQLFLEQVSKSNAAIGFRFLRFDSHPNCHFVQFHLRTEHHNLSELYAVTLSPNYSEARVVVSYKNYCHPETLWEIINQRLTVLLWMQDLKSSDVLQSEFRSEKASVMEDSDEEETNSKSDGVAEDPEDAAEELSEDETDPDYENLKKLQKDFEKLLLNREDSDVTLEVQGIEFPAHKNILRTRSPVFNAMFKHKMKETNSDSVTIEDSDPKTFPDFLKYLYTGSTKHVNQENVCQLYTTSDKYEVMELKAKCAEFMKCSMTVETFCEYFSLAHMHTEEELFRSGIEFFCAHTIEIAQTAKWQIFLQENLTVGNELFLKAVSRLTNI